MKGSIITGFKELWRDKIITLYCVFFITVLTGIIQIISMMMHATMLYQEQEKRDTALFYLLLSALWGGMVLFLFIVNKLMIHKRRKTYVIYHMLGMKVKEIQRIIISKSVILSLISSIFMMLFGFFLYLVVESGTLFKRLHFFDTDIFIKNQIACFMLVIVIAMFSNIKSLEIDAMDIYCKKEYSEGLFNIRLGDKSSGKWKYPFLMGIKKMQQDIYNLLAVLIPITIWVLFFIRLSYHIEQIWVIGDWRDDWNCDYVVSLEDDSKFISDDFIREVRQIKGVETYEQWDSVSTTDEGVVETCEFEVKLPKNLVTEAGRKQLALCNVIEDEDDKVYYHILTSALGYEDDGLEKLNEYLVDGVIDSRKMKEENIILLPKYIFWSANLDLPYCNLKVGDKISMTAEPEPVWSSMSSGSEKEIEFTIGGFLSGLPLPYTTAVSNGYGLIMHSSRLNQLQVENIGVKYVSIFGGREYRGKIEKLCREYGYEVEERADDFATKSNFSIVIFYIFFGMICIMIFLADFHVVFTKIVERKKEYGVLHILGFERKQQMVAFIAESILPIFSGIVLGNIFGILWVYDAIRKDTGNIYPIRYLIPWRNILVMNIVGILAIFMAVCMSYQYLKKEE